MSSFTCIEEIDAWKAARFLALDLHQLTTTGAISRDFTLRDQLNKASGSIMDNIAEGFERGGNREFINFLSYSRGSCAEVRSQLYRALDRKHISQEIFEKYNKETLRVSAMIWGLMSYLIGSDYKGFKFNPKNKPDRPES